MSKTFFEYVWRRSKRMYTVQNIKYLKVGKNFLWMR
jgi:hypothetical protein